MKKLSIISLNLTNFKGIRSLSLDFNGHNASIYGRNASGKTTVEDSVTWLLFGKDSSGSANFSIKPLVDGVPESNLEHVVEGVFFDGDKEITLKKVYQEKWTKKRGSLTAEFTGHTTDHYIDGLGTPAKKFSEIVTELTADSDKFQLLSSPTFFSEKMTWKARRDMIIDLVGDISDEDVIASDKELSTVPGILNGKSVEDRIALIGQAKKQANKDIESIPNRIDEKKRGLPELTVTNPEHLVKKLTNLHTNLSAQNKKIASLEAGGGSAEIETEIAKVNGDIQRLKNSFAEKDTEALQAKRSKLQVLEEGRARHNKVLQDLKVRRDVAATEIDNLERVLLELKGEYKNLKSFSFTESACPTCGQDFPKEDIEKARSAFNANRAKAIEDNIVKGKSTKGKIEDIKSSQTTLIASIKETEKTVDEFDLQVETLNKEISNHNYTVIETTAEFITLDKKRATLQDQLDKSAKSNSNSALIESETEIKLAIEEDIKKNNALVAQIEQYNKDIDRIAELKKEEKSLSALYEKLSGQLFILEKLIKAKVAMLEGRVAEKFPDVGFKMFSPQINGGLTETCEVTVNGVPYADLNNAAKIQSGISIINTFAEHYQFSTFIFIDNRESVTDIPDTEAQVISLIVSPDDKALRVECLEAELAN